jgi:hypothetical protein
MELPSGFGAATGGGSLHGHKPAAGVKVLGKPEMF